MTWVSPLVRCEFGPYFRTDPAEQLQVLTMAQLAAGGSAKSPKQLVPMRVVIEKIADVFGVENVQVMLDDLKKEQDAQSQKDASEAKTNADAAHARDMQLQGSLADTLKHGNPRDKGTGGGAGKVPAAD